mmetsp:Transcript_19653/g.34831  ORF Transcript_19653/g.34831 Transcript_19653/m.34831 type:complete len:263 (+) Transcript_19653:72-860(+)|eukprot:CAMPEP_0197655994 /NCGR_PEP_ID=MMETSP1338-20131121/39802_1 /TAXON_ID=43686 ORGANISM="Pelagodinium beii, Strain RCC1491" /NCGR_SAMPLE_ID=MMETSP1338 /ASSEMBLY_ACC=CAM_ASM_000754 /LENGTH=262 /DNA_ID=CAMNT_0043231771 /DNA_START=69 /DNA_END=857 /DNA_ORIENTATION=+
MGIFQRFRKEEGTPLQADLKAVTESNVMEPPKETINMVVEATKLGAEERREIMMHLREVLAEPQTKKWRRMYAGLVLTEELLKSGAPELFVETSGGHYFDLVQRLSLLETFECTTDLRVQNMVRTKAAALRAEALPKLELAQTEETHSTSPSGGSGKGVDGTSDHSSMSGTSTSTSASSKNGFAGYVTKPDSQMILNGIVAVGHNDDTDSESDGENTKAVAYRKTKQAPVAPAAPQATQSRDTVSTAASASNKPAEVDLLDL